MIYAIIIFIAILLVLITTIAYIIRLVWHYFVVVCLLQPEHDAEIRVDNATLRTWPTLTYAEARSQDPRVVNTSCCFVCLVDYEEDEGENKALRHLPECGHLFHATCVDSWLRRRHTCPICRSLVVNGAMQTHTTEVIPIEIEQA